MLRLDYNLIFEMINLIIFYLLMKRFLIGPVMKVIEKRKELITGTMEEADKTEKSAILLKNQYEEKLANANIEREEIVDNAKKQAKTEYDRVLKEANEKAIAIRKEAEEAIEVEHANAVKNLEREIAGLAIVASAKIINDNNLNINGSKMYGEFLKKAGDGYDTNSN